MTTAPAQRYVAVASGTRGLALLAPGFFEYELAADGDLRMTLLRCVGHLSRADLSTRPGHAGWPTPTPEAQCPGVDRFQLAVVPVGAADLQAGSALPELWEDVFLPPRALWLRQATPLRTPDLDVRARGRRPRPLGGQAGCRRRAGVALLQRGDGAGGGSLAARMGRGCAPSCVRADERGGRALALADGGRSIPFHAGPRAIVTVLVDGPP